jgi:hypothetical protein
VRLWLWLRLRLRLLFWLGPGLRLGRGFTCSFRLELPLDVRLGCSEILLERSRRIVLRNLDDGRLGDFTALGSADGDRRVNRRPRYIRQVEEVFGGVEDPVA